MRFSPLALVHDSMIATALTLVVWIQLTVPRVVMRARVPLPPVAGPFFFRAVTPEPMAYVLAALCVLPLALRRRYPLWVLGSVTIAAAIFDNMRHPPSLAIFGPLLAMYTVGTVYERPRVVSAWAFSTTVLLVTSLPPFFDQRWLGSFVAVVGLFGIAAALGDATRNRRAYIAEVERRAEEAEARAEEEARRRVDEERLRIARELHDITAHSMSVIAVQSGMAAHVIEQDPEAARRALDDIRTTSKRALQELRSVLGVMRAEGEQEAPLTPTPGLARLPELVRAAEESGFDVRLETSEDLADLPQLVDSSAYRIVQEAITNALRHAKPPAELTVAVRVEESTLTIEVVNGGAYAGTLSPVGHGIAGMRERAAALGGEFSAGPVSGERWRVAATLPVGGRSV